MATHKKTMVELKDIEKLAELSRIRLSDEEKAQMRKDIVSILSYIDQIKQVSADSGKKSGASSTSKRVERELVRNVLREDANPHQSGIHTEDVLKNAPGRKGNYLKVKKIL